MRAVRGDVATGSAGAVLRLARRCVLFALSRAPADVPAGALDRRALVRFLGRAVALRGNRLAGRHRGLDRLLSGVRAADHALAAAPIARHSTALNPRTTRP